MRHHEEWAYGIILAYDYPNLKRRFVMFEDLGFCTRMDVRNSTSIARFFAGADRCGIYILHFANGELYVGQAQNVSRRFLEHRRTFLDIEFLSFKRVSEAQLDDVEAFTAETLETRGYHLRNIQLVSMTFGETEFDAIMAPADQDLWLADSTFCASGGVRRVDESFRAKYKQRFPLYQQMPDADRVTAFAARYTQRTVPAACSSERDFWSISCRPYPGLYLRMNINSMEVLSVFHDEELLVSFHVTRSILVPLLRENAHPWVRVWRGPAFTVVDHAYKPGGADQVNIVCRLRDAERLIDDQRFLSAARTMNLRLMRKGINLNARSHCYDLADLLLADIPISA